MEYQNVDEEARRQACENVKKIAEAIIKIRKKYYLCFSKISEDDQKRYNQLKTHMQSIASENGLEKLNAELISDINTQYSEDIPEDKNGNISNGSLNDLYQKYIKAVELQAEFTIAFSKTLNGAYLKKAKKIQSHRKKIEEKLEECYSKSRLSFEKGNILREKFTQTKDYMKGLLEECYNNVTSKDPKGNERATSRLNQQIKTTDILEQTI